MWKEHGFLMNIPSGVVNWHESISFFIAIVSFGSAVFSFPEGTQPISAIYYVRPSKPLTKPVTIRIQHSYRMDAIDSGGLQFAIAQEDKLEYGFLSQKGTFYRNKHYGEIDITDTSLLTSIAEGDDIDYVLFIKQAWDNLCTSGEVTITASQNLATCKQVP